MENGTTNLKYFKNSGNYSHAIIIAIIAIISGIIVGTFTLQSAYRELNNEHHDHLTSLVWSSDRNLDHLFTYCRQELLEEVSNYRGYEYNDIVNSFKGSRILKDEKFDAVVLVDDMKICETSDRTIRKLNFPKDYSFKKPCLCSDNNDRSYLAIIEQTGSGSIDIAVLLRLDKFFEKFVGHEIMDDYWIALYDIDNSLCIQDDPTQPFVKNISYEAGMERSDGIRILVDSEMRGSIRSAEYRFLSESTNSEKFIITALPTCLNDNGFFTIGISVPTEHYESILNNIFLRTVICASLIVFGLLIIYILARRHRQVNEEMLTKIKLLREKNETMRHLMDTSRELAHQQRLVSIGTIASNINHEFSNLLTPIMGYSVLAMEKLPDGDCEVMDYLEKIYDSSSKAKNLVAKLLKLSRKGSNNDHLPISPDDVLDKIEDILLPAKPKNVKVEKDYNCPNARIMANETQIEQILINLVLNAFQAMADTGGTLRITSRVADGSIVLSLQDSGPGISEEALPHIFEPFYTTKSADMGSGLGLAIVAQLVEDHHGRIDVVSRLGKGSEFTLRFPLCH